MPDTDRGAAVILDEFRGGKLGRLTLQSAPVKRAAPADRAEPTDAAGQEDRP